MSFKYKELVLGEEYADLLQEPAAAIESALDIEACSEDLIENLKSQLKLYTEYLAQANRQRMALINRQLTENGDSNVESERLIGSLATLEEKRISITKKIISASKQTDFGISQEMGTNPASVKCEAIYPLLSPIRASRLKECRDALVKATGDLKHVLTINMALVENGSNIIHTTVGIITSVVGRKSNEKMNTYTAKGYVHVGKIQVRNLINRSV